MSIRTPVNLALLNDAAAAQFCDTLDLASLLGALGPGCAAASGPTGDGLLTESGDYLLAENGDYLILE